MSATEEDFVVRTLAQKSGTATARDLVLRTLDEKNGNFPATTAKNQGTVIG